MPQSTGPVRARPPLTKRTALPATSPTANPVAAPPAPTVAPHPPLTTTGARSARLLVDPRGVSVPLWAVLPLRLFLGVTFLYAGIQKLTDPGFFRLHSATYIGTQISAFAHHSPIGGFLTAVALPHAVAFGALVAWGEVAIGLGALAGVLFRPATFFGALISLTLWLSATWQVKPYFYGADIFALFGWLTLLAAGTRGVLALDPLLGGWARAPLTAWLGRERAATTLAWLGLAPGDPATPLTPAAPATVGAGRKPTARRAREQDRRRFLQGAAAGVGASIAGAAIWNLFHPAPTNSGFGLLGGSGTGVTTGASTTGAVSGGTTTSASATSGAIANLSSFPTNSAVTFTIPSNQDPGVAVRLDSGTVVAFDATCTHAGCPVQYDQGSKLLLCPCHGAAFDPAQNAAVVQGPAPVPLTPVTISVNQQTGAVSLS